MPLPDDRYSVTRANDEVAVALVRDAIPRPGSDEPLDHLNQWRFAVRLTCKWSQASGGLENTRISSAPGLTQKTRVGIR